MAGRTAQLGPGHVSTLRAKGNLAILLAETGVELVEARRMYEEVVAGQTAQLGPAHVDTLLTKSNLALLLMEMREWAEARRMHEGVVAGRTA